MLHIRPQRISRDGPGGGSSCFRMHRGAENNLLGSLRLLLLFFFAQKRMLVKGAPFGCMLLTAQKRMLVKGAPFGCMLLTALQSQTSGAVSAEEFSSP